MPIGYTCMIRTTIIFWMLTLHLALMPVLGYATIPIDINVTQVHLRPGPRLPGHEPCRGVRHPAGAGPRFPRQRGHQQPELREPTPQ